MKKIKPIYNIIVCAVAVILFAWGLWAFSPGLLIAATVVAGLAALGLAFMRFAETRSVTSVLLGVTALWLLAGKAILGLASGPIVARDLKSVKSVETALGISRTAEAWECYAVIAGALLLLMVAVLLLGRRPTKAEAEPGKSE